MIKLHPILYFVLPLVIGVSLGMFLFHALGFLLTAVVAFVIGLLYGMFFTHR